MTAAPVRCSAWLAVRSDSVETWNKSLEKTGYRDNAWNVATCERGADDTEHGADDAEHGAEGAERGAEDAERSAEGAERGADDAEHGAENAERSADDAESGAENAECSADPELRSEVWSSFMGDVRERLTNPSSATAECGAVAARWVCGEQLP